MLWCSGCYVVFWVFGYYIVGGVVARLCLVCSGLGFDLLRFALLVGFAVIMRMYA